MQRPFRFHKGREISLSEIVPFLSGYLVVVGLLLGSFTNLAADRLPRGESLIRPRSHCRACERRLDVVDLLPILGYVLRGGRCATCRAPIGISAPFVEMVSGVFVLVGIAWFGFWPGSALGLGLAGLWGVIVTTHALQRRIGPELGRRPG